MNEFLLIWAPEYSQAVALAIMPLIENSIARWAESAYAELDEHFRKRPGRKTMIVFDSFAIHRDGKPIQALGQEVFGLKVIRRFAGDYHAELVCYVGPRTFIDWVDDWILTNAKDVAIQKKIKVTITEKAVHD